MYMATGREGSIGRWTYRTAHDVICIVLLINNVSGSFLKQNF